MDQVDPVPDSKANAPCTCTWAQTSSPHAEPLLVHSMGFVFQGAMTFLAGYPFWLPCPIRSPPFGKSIYCDV